MKSLALAGRILFSLIFIFAAFGHFKSETIGYAASQGVPLADLAVPASGILALAGGLMVAFGFRARLGAAALVAFLVPVTLMMHKFWGIADPMQAQLQLAMFLKNFSLIGGALFIAYAGAGAYSLDSRARRTPVTATASA
jgi:putative oxidoreductase